MSDHSHGGNRYVSLLQEFSIPLLAGVVVALAVANTNLGLYDQLVHGTWTVFTGEEYHGHGSHDAEGDHGHDSDHGHDHDEHDSDHDGDEGHSDHSDKDEHAGHDHGDDGHHEGEHNDGDHGEAGHDEGSGGHGAWWHHYATLHFIVNDLFMVLFFGIAAKEITEACLPGGALNPVSKAINPLLGTIGSGASRSLLPFQRSHGRCRMAQRMGNSDSD